MVEQTDIAVATLINKFNAVTPQLMQTFKQQIAVSYTQDILGLFICGFIIIACIIGLVLLYKRGKTEKYSFGAYYSDGQTFGMIICWCLLVFAIIGLIVVGFDLIQIILNPDYYVLTNYIKPLLS